MKLKLFIPTVEMKRLGAGKVCFPKKVLNAFHARFAYFGVPGAP